MASQHQVFAEKPAEYIAACFILPHPSSPSATALSSQFQPAQLSKPPHLLFVLLFAYFSGGSALITASLPDCTVDRQREDGMDTTWDGHWERSAYLCFTSTAALRLSRYKGRQMSSGPKGAAWSARCFWSTQGWGRRQQHLLMCLTYKKSTCSKLQMKK